jgi:hypothetical protein
MKTAELTGAALDWAVAKCEGVEVEYINDGITRCLLRLSPFTGRYSPSTDWNKGGPIIERECIGLRGPSMKGNLWAAFIDHSGVSQGPQHRHTGPTPLIAAMRCYVASKLGDEVEIPSELA